MKTNIFRSQHPEPASHEVVQELFQGGSFKLEKIISMGHATPSGTWYDQDSNEWIILLSGAAQLRFEDDTHLLDMHPGDYILIPAHRRHRVDWTDPVQKTIWLAVHFQQ